MKNLVLLTEALAYIEEHLTDELKTEQISQALFCSKSTLEKLFKYVNNITVRDYVVKRRMSKAANELAGDKNLSILDLGIKYGYSSNEAFTRAFQSIWHTTPSEFRQNPRKFNLFPRYMYDAEIMEDESMSSRKKVDISELYDLLRERKDCYIVGGDIKCLIPINNISIEAGDIAIITAMERMEAAAGDEDIVFRVGGDEFVILTASGDLSYAEGIVEKVLSQNGKTFTWQDQEIPLSMYATAIKFMDSNLRYSEVFTKIQNELDESKLK